MADTTEPKSREAEIDGLTHSSRSGTPRRKDRRSGDGRERCSGESPRRHCRSTEDRDHRKSDEDASSLSSSRSRPSTSDCDREAKRNARTERDGTSSAAPEVVAVASDSSANSRRSVTRGSGETKEEHMRRRAEKEEEIKKRAKEGGSSARRSDTRDLEAKIRAREGRGAALTTTGAQMATSRGEDRISGMERQNARERAEWSSNPTIVPPTSGGDDDDVDAVALKAIAADEEAVANDRIRALEEQNRVLLERMEELINNPVPNNNEEGKIFSNKDGEGDEEEVEVTANQKRAKNKSNICILVALLLAAGGGNSAYFVLTQPSDEPVSVAPIAPAVNQDDTPALIVPVVSDTLPPTVMDSASPSSSPTIDTYDQ